MKIVVLDALTLGEDMDFSPLEELGELTVYPSSAQNEVAGRIKGFDAVVFNKIKMNRENLEGSGVKLLCVTATGYDNIDIDYCRKSGIAVMNVVNYSTDSVAQLTVGLVLELTMHLRSYFEYVQSGKYSKSGVANHLIPVFCELSGKTWGVIGMGAIGKAVAKIAVAFGCKVIYTRNTPDGNEACVGLLELMRKSDIITVHLPLTQNTRGILDEKILSLMKEQAVIVNTSRGAVFDEAALAKALIERRIAGAAVDVFSVEPLPENHPFTEIKDMPNFLMTPHMAWGAYEARCRLVKNVALNIKAFSDGRMDNRIV